MGILDDRINEFISASCFAEKYEAWKDSYAKDIDDDYAKFMFATKIVGISQEAFESWVAEDATSVAWHIPGGCAISLQNEAAPVEPATTTPATPTPTPATTEPATTEPANPTIEPTLTVSPTEVTIEVGEKTTITASLTSSVENPDYLWNVPAIVTGESTTASIEVTGAEAGTGTITVSAANLNASATITVTAPVEPATPNAEP